MRVDRWHFPQDGTFLRKLEGMKIIQFLIFDLFGRVLDVVHQPVPTLNHNIGDSIQRYFTNMQPSSTYSPTHVRYNWNLEVDDTLRIPKGLFFLVVHGFTPFVGEEGSLHDHKLEDLYLRLERQTLRKLPRSKAICFTVGILLWPLSRLLTADPSKKETLLEHLKDNSYSEYRYKQIRSFISKIDSNFHFLGVIIGNIEIVIF